MCRLQAGSGSFLISPFSLQPSISESGCTKVLCSFTRVFAASLSLSLFLSPCLKIEKRHKAGYCSGSLGYWLLSAPLEACLGLKQHPSVSTEPSNTNLAIESQPPPERGDCVTDATDSASAESWITCERGTYSTCVLCCVM